MDNFAIKNEQMVATPDGFVDPAVLRPGDQVMTMNGSPAVLAGVESKGVVPVYRFRFDDGTAVVCDEEQRFLVREDGDDLLMVVKAKRVIDRPDKYSFPCGSPVLFNNEGNTSKKEKIFHDAGCDPTGVDSAKLLDKLPTAHARQREAFLNGMMDERGDVNDFGEGIYCTQSRGLLALMKDLALSLAFRVLAVEDDQQTGMKWIRFKPTNPQTRLFRTDKAAQKMVSYLDPADAGKRLQSVQPFGSREIFHLKVEGEDGCYVGNNYNLLYDDVDRWSK